MGYTGRTTLLQDVFRAVIMVAVAVTLVMLPRVVLAHAVLVQSSPAANEVVAGPDVPLTLKFNSRVDGARSTLSLGPVGGPAKPLTLEKQPSPDTLTAHASQLAPGKYVIHWQALAVDGHISRGQIAFEVK